MQHIPALPENSNIDYIQKILLSATERLQCDLPALVDSAVPSRQELLCFLEFTALDAIKGYIDLLHDDDTRFRSAVDKACSFFSTQPNSPEQSIPVDAALRTRNAFLNHIMEDIGNDLSSDTRLSLYQGLLIVTDQILTSSLASNTQACQYQMISADKPQREYLDGILHDLRSPLSLITGCSQTFLSGQTSPTTQRVAVETIKNASLQVNELAKNLLDISAIEHGELVHKFTTVPIPQSLETLLHNRSDVQVLPLDFYPENKVEEEARTTDGSRNNCDDSKENLLAWTDLPSLHRVVTNLVDNAVQHGEPPITVKTTGDKDQICIVVSDTGKTDPIIIEQAFRGRVHSAKGFGIGLRATYLLLKATGGSIRLLSSAPTSFGVWLPQAKRP